MAIAYLSLGSNLGDRRAHILAAINKISRFALVHRTSTILEYEPMGMTNQPDFLNAVLEIETKDLPRDLLSKLQGIEKQLGRVRTQKNGPRTIDLDILAYEEETIADRDLTIPHPRMHERRFVLEPMAELNPVWLHPIHQKTVACMLKELVSKKED